MLLPSRTASLSPFFPLPVELRGALSNSLRTPFPAYPLSRGKGHILRLRTRANQILGCQIYSLLSPFGFLKGELLRSPSISSSCSLSFCGCWYGTFMRNQNRQPKELTHCGSGHTGATNPLCPLPRECGCSFSHSPVGSAQFHPECFLFGVDPPGNDCGACFILD